MSTKTDMLEKIGDIGNKVTMTTGGTSLLLGWFTTEHVLSLIAAICTVAGMLITWYYKREAARRLAQEAARRAEIHALRVETQRLHNEELRERLRLLLSGDWPESRINTELDRLNSDQGQLEKDE
jgi:hypothetical protein|nr:MAG TPA: holin [Caudoviricetes sp.]